MPLILDVSPNPLDRRAVIEAPHDDPVGPLGLQLPVAVRCQWRDNNVVHPGPACEPVGPDEGRKCVTQPLKVTSATWVGGGLAVAVAEVVAAGLLLVPAEAEEGVVVIGDEASGLWAIVNDVPDVDAVAVLMPVVAVGAGFVAAVLKSRVLSSGGVPGAAILHGCRTKTQPSDQDMSINDIYTTEDNEKAFSYADVIVFLEGRERVEDRIEKIIEDYEYFKLKDGVTRSRTGVAEQGMRAQGGKLSEKPQCASLKRLAM
ncbi:hypothetical protein AAG570_010086 [Ranatra chinensis]|uniref:Uncharacterized protein n=1 Tax=Ranatra chinensis TaxID=642074 RepID=A0ABD0YLP2_9HEMI